MNIAFDAKRAISNYTGLGNYSRSTVRALVNYHREHNYFLYTPSFRKHPRVSFLEEPGTVFIKKPSSFIYQQVKPLWRSYGIVDDLKKENIEVYHGLSHELPMGIKKSSIKTVVTIHDLIYLRFPQYFPFIDRKIYDLKFRHACRVAHKIIAISEQTKADLINFFELDEQKIEIVYQCCDPVFLTKKSDIEKQKIKEKYSLPDRFILSVGTVEERKNLLVITKALREIPDAVSLVVVGRQTAYAEQVKQYLQQNRLNSRVQFVSQVDFNDLPTIYQLAELFVYPSVFEGFGIPIIEALSSGVPVITSTGCSCFSEAGGSKSIYVNPHREQEWATQMNRALADTSLQNEMITSGKEYVERFSERSMTDNLMNIYVSLVSNR